MLSLKQLTEVPTAQQATAYAMSLLQSLGFQTTGWADGKIQKTLIRTIGTTISDFSEAVKFIALSGFNDFAEGEWLTEFSKSRYGNIRSRAIATEGPATLTSIASIPYTIQVGQLIATTSDGIQFRNTTGGTLSAGSVSAPATLELEWKAVLAGERGNNGNINRLVTALAGVSINTTGDPWYTTSGKDDESDATLRLRNSTKWARLTVEPVADSYINMALTAGASKVGVSDSNPRGAGTIDVICAGTFSKLSDSDLAAIQADFARRVLQTDANYPPASTSRVATLHPDPHPLNIDAKLFHDPKISGPEAQTRVVQALEDFLARTPLGGWTYGAAAENAILVEDLAGVIKNVEGIRTALILAPATTVQIGTLNLVTKGTWTFETVAVQGEA